MSRETVLALVAAVAIGFALHPGGDITFAPRVAITTGDVDILEDVLEYINIGDGVITVF
ncbi:MULTISPECIES: hypothetical protein [unclassified Streptomyces]|uniref:hypothetical protein n=1 Tax=unclassified Streptomyces TaxID=2593676 RepID=UPI003812C219